MILGNYTTTGDPVELSDVDRRQHLYAIGQTGTGKTTWLLSLMAQDFATRRGFCFIDKHGDAAKAISDSSPVPHLYWKPADLSHIVGLNPLENVPPDDRWRVTADIVSIFSDIWKLGPETPRLLYYLRAAVRLLLDTPCTTLLDIRRVLSDDNYRSKLLRKCGDRETRQTWTEFTAKSDKDQTIEIASLQNKVAALADPLPLRYVIGQPTSTINIRKLMDSGTSLVVDLSDMGDEPARLLGALLVSSFARAAEARSSQAEGLRKDYTLYVDEFQNFASLAFGRILSEARKWRLSLSLAHQFISQLPEELQHAILGNCGTIVSFRVGAADAPIISRAIDAPEQDLKDMGRGEAWVRLLEGGMPTDAHRMTTRKVDLPTGHLKSAIKNTRASFSRSRKDVEKMLIPHPQQRSSIW
jgi:hypothetical protein